MTRVGRCPACGHAKVNAYCAHPFHAPAPSPTGAAEWDDVGGRPTNPDPLAQWAEPGAAAGAMTEERLAEIRRNLLEKGWRPTWDETAALFDYIDRLRSSPVSAADGALREAAVRLYRVGQQMSNVAYNIKQGDGLTTPARAREILGQLQEEWDARTADFRAALAGLPSAGAMTLERFEEIKQFRIRAKQLGWNTVVAALDDLGREVARLRTALTPVDLSGVVDKK